MSYYGVFDISFAYGKNKVLKDITIDIDKGSVVSLLGPNGTGKTTLMKIFLGLLKPKSGFVRLSGKGIDYFSPSELARNIAYVPQASVVAFAFSALEIVMMARVSSRSFFARPSAIDKKIALESMERLGVAHLAESIFQTLSGGQKQLVLIARALAQEARIFVMDEPVSGLDYGNQLKLLETILDLSCEGYTFLKSTHFPEHALMLGGRTIAIKDGSVFADGITHDIVNEKLVNVLYETDVSIRKTECGFPVCVPRFYHK